MRTSLQSNHGFLTDSYNQVMYDYSLTGVSETFHSVNHPKADTGRHCSERQQGPAQQTLAAS